MTEVIVLGGYGRVGSLCVRELLETTSARVVVAGRNAQRAESVALGFGERASGAYIDARDPRTFADQLESADLVVCCSGGEPIAALDAALETRTPFLCLSSFWLDPRATRNIAERAWQAQAPMSLLNFWIREKTWDLCSASRRLKCSPLEARHGSRSWSTTPQPANVL